MSPKSSAPKSVRLRPAAALKRGLSARVAKGDALAAFRFGDEDVLVLRNARRMVVLGRTSEGALRGRVFSSRPDEGFRRVGPKRAEAAWIEAKNDAPDVIARTPFDGSRYRKEGGFGFALQQAGLLDKNSVEPDSPGYGKRESAVVEKIAALIDLRAVETLFPVLPGFTAIQYEWIRHPDPSGKRVELLESFPYAAGILSRHGDLVDAAFKDDVPIEEIVLTAMVADGAVDAAMVASSSARRRVAGMIASTAGIARAGFDGPAQFLRLGLPVERIPDTGEEWLAFDELHRLARISSTFTGNLRDLMDVPRGEYAKLRGRIAKTRFGEAITGPDGMLSTRAFLIGRRELSERATDVLTLPLAISRRGYASREGMFAATDKMLFDKKSLFGVIETIDGYHGDARTFTDAVASIASQKKISWPAPMAKEFSRPGRRYVWLTTPAELKAEGAKGKDADGIRGLDHCVGGYVVPCMEGRSFILSVRSDGSDGDVERIATAEFQMQGDHAVLIQVSGPKNAPVTPDVEDEIERIGLLLDRSPAALDPEWGRECKSILSLVVDDEDMEIVRTGLSEYLPRDMRSCDLSDMFETLESLEPDPDPNADYRLVPMPGR